MVGCAAFAVAFSASRPRCSFEGMSRVWYQLALAPAAGSSTGTLVTAAGNHLGEALAEVARSHPKRVVLAARRATSAPLGESVGKSRPVSDATEPISFPATWLHWPDGVLPDVAALASLTGAGPGYVVHDEPDLVVIEAQVAADQVVDLFLGLLERLPVVDNLELRLMHHFDEAEHTEVWLSPRIGGKRILRFLDAHERELIGSGAVELAVYARQEQSTLRLTEHKTVLFTSRELATSARTTKALLALGVRPVASLVALAQVPHFHYRPGGSKDRAALGKYLEKQRMRLVDRLDPAGASLGAGAARA